MKARPKRLPLNLPRVVAGCVLGLLLLVLLQAGSDAGPPATAAPEVLPDRVRVAEALRSSPVMFIENVGQFDDRARFQVRGAMGTMWLAQDAIWVTLVERAHVDTLERFDLEHANVQREDEQLRSVNLKLTFPGANPHPRLEPFGRLDTVVSYFIGNDPEKWHPDVPVWAGVRYVDLYPGVDLEITSEGGRLVWRLACRRRPEPVEGVNCQFVAQDARLRVEGADTLAVDGGVALRLMTAVGEFFLPLLMVDGIIPIGESTIVNLERGTSEVICPFTSAPLFLDTSASSLSLSLQDNPDDLLYSTFIGGGVFDRGASISVDGAGSTYVTGYTGSSNFPTTPGAFDTSIGGQDDAFVVKVNASGTALAYATFLGGLGYDRGASISVDDAGSTYVTGYTLSSNFPTTPGAFDTSINGSGDVFVLKLNAGGTELLYSTLIGGSSSESGRAIAIDEVNNAYVTGGTSSPDFPATPGAFDTSYNGVFEDGFVVKVNADGADLVYATFLGGSGEIHEAITSIAVDTAGNAYVAGHTDSPDFPVTGGSFDTHFNGCSSGHEFCDSFVAKINADGRGLYYATFLGGGGGAGGESVNSITIDESGNAYVTGWTESTDFPTTEGAFDTSHNGSEDAFVVKVNASGTALAYATFLGGSHFDRGNGIAVDGAGSAYVMGHTLSFDFPTTARAFDTSYNSQGDAFVVKLDTGGTGLSYATFLGGSEADLGITIAVDGAGNAYVGGYTHSPNFPTTSDAFDRACGTDGNCNYDGYRFYSDVFLARLALRGEPGLSVSHIEVTQATQDENNSVPLIAGKPTFVRVYVGCGPEGALPEDAAVALRGYGPSGELGAPRTPFGGYIRTACREDMQAQRSDLRKTLNFSLSEEWITGTITLTAEIDGVSRSEEFSFLPARTVQIRYVPIHYDPFPSCLWLNKDPDSARIARAYQWAQKVYPTARIEYLPWPGMDWGLPLRTLACLGSADLEAGKALNFSLSLQWSLAEGPRPDYVFGWLPDDATGGGMADPHWPDWPGIGVAAHGDDDPSHGPRIFAHEIGHLLGRRHTRATSDPRPACANLDQSQYNDWPYATAGIQEYGMDIDIANGSFRLQSPSEAYDYMSYCWYHHDLPAWTSPHTYRQIHSQTLGVQTAGLAVQPLSTPQPYLISSGLVYTDDTAILNPAWVITSTITPENPPAGTQYCLEAQNASGTALASHCFDLTFVNYETGEATNVDGFNLMLPYPGGVARIVLKKGTGELAVQAVSANAPVVTIIAPNGGETWSATGAYTVTWTSDDIDGDPLTYSVLYSPDGSDWVPVGTTITHTQLVVNAAELAGSISARIRVLASDGVHTSSDESDAPFTVERKAPQAFIISPEADSATLAGTPVWLEGYAYDLENGTLSDAALSWSSSRDGDLGIGPQVLTTLSLGQHTLTFRATDSDTNTATATVQILVTFPEDVVPDCQVDALDVQAIAGRWRQRSTDPGWDPGFDLAGDDLITVADIMRVVAAWGDACS